MGVSTYLTTPPPDLGLIPLILSILWCLALHSLCNLYVCTCCWNLDFSDCIHSLITFMHLADFLYKATCKRGTKLLLCILCICCILFFYPKSIHIPFFTFIIQCIKRKIMQEIMQENVLYLAWVCRVSQPGWEWPIAGVAMEWLQICHVVEIWRDLVKRWRRGGRCIERYGWVEREKLFSCTIK